MTRPPLSPAALVASAVLTAAAAAVWLAGGETRIRVLLVAARGTDREWLASVAAGLRTSYGERLVLDEARWTVDLSDAGAGDGPHGPRVPLAEVVRRIPWVPGDPYVAVVCDADLRAGTEESSPWVHGIGLPYGVLVVSVRRLVVQFPGVEARRRVGAVASHEFGHVLAYAHCRDRSLMAWVAPGEDPAGPGLALSREDGFELDPRMLVRGALDRASWIPLPAVLIPLFALPGLALLCVVWHGLRWRFGTLRMTPWVLANAAFLHVAAVSVGHYGWSALLPPLSLLHHLASRLLPRAGGWVPAAAALGGGVLLGAAGLLADLGYLTAGARFDAAGWDAEGLAAFPGAVLAVALLRASWSDPVEGARAWGGRTQAAVAAVAAGLVAALASSPSAALGGAACGFAAIRVFAVRALPIDLPSVRGPRGV